MHEVDHIKLKIPKRASKKYFETCLGGMARMNCEITVNSTKKSKRKLIFTIQRFLISSCCVRKMVAKKRTF